MDDERMRILKRVEAGEITAEEAVRQLNALAQAPQVETGPDPETISPEPEQAACAPRMDIPKRFTHFWLYPLWLGVATVVAGAVLLYAVYGAFAVNSASASVWLSLCGWPLFGLGVLTTAVAWWMRTARWVHVRVTGRDNIVISLPLPLRLTAWVIQVARPLVPQFRDTGVDKVIRGLSDTLSHDGQPIYVDVHDDEGGEHVQIYIG